jgi:small-conductance mechanosensitive channel
VVVIPNSVVAGRNIVNVESESGRQVFQVFRLAPDTSADKIEKAMKILKSSVKDTEGTKELAVTGFISANEISRDVMLLYWVVPEASNVKTRTQINLNIVRAFEHEGIQFTDRAEYHYQKDSPL